MDRLRKAVNGVNLKRFRFWLQLGFFVLFVYGGYAAVKLGNSLPTFSCGFTGSNPGVCYLLPLQHQLSMNWATLFGWAGVGVLTAFLTFWLWFIFLNKAWCGYACPLGTIQDWITALRTRLGVRPGRYDQATFEGLSWVKYVLLLLMIALPLGVGGGFLSHNLGTPFCDICPARMILPLFNGDTSQWVVDFSTREAMVMTALGMAITGLFFAGSFIKKRFFCFFCPMSALHYLLSKPALLRLKKEGDKCTRCGDCYRACDMQIKAIADDVTSKNIMKDDCILCFKCVAACPEEGALKVTFAAKTIFEATEEGFAKRMKEGNKDGA